MKEALVNENCNLIAQTARGVSPSRHEYEIEHQAVKLSNVRELF